MQEEHAGKTRITAPCKDAYIPNRYGSIVLLCGERRLQFPSIVNTYEDSCSVLESKKTYAFIYFQEKVLLEECC